VRVARKGFASSSGCLLAAASAHRDGDLASTPGRERHARFDPLDQATPALNEPRRAELFTLALGVGQWAQNVGDCRLRWRAAHT
jgi:hypothetical protein